jgi:RHS repeat-associated protein
VSVVQDADTYEFRYNGLGDRVVQITPGSEINYTLDLNAGLTQVLADGTNAYLYGAARIGEEQPGGWQYHLGDALGSVRQLVRTSAVPTLAEGYGPFGNSLASAGGTATAFEFTGETRDATGLLFLRARYYASMEGRFTSRDVWDGDPLQPISNNLWAYAYANPTRYTDPTGWWPVEDDDQPRKVYPHNVPAVCRWLAHSYAGGCLELCRDLLDLSPDWRYVGKFNLSAYYRPHESQFEGDPNVPIPATKPSAERQFLSRHGGYVAKSSDPNVLRASEGLLYDADAICMNGSGRLLDGRVISCDPNPGSWRFDWSGPGRHRAFKTVARLTGSAYFDDGDRLLIPELMGFLGRFDTSFVDGVLEVTDVGGGLSSAGIEALDLFTGEGKEGLDAYNELMDCTTAFPASDWWNRHPEVCKVRPPIPELVDVYSFTH